MSDLSHLSSTSESESLRDSYFAEREIRSAQEQQQRIKYVIDDDTKTKVRPDAKLTSAELVERYWVLIKEWPRPFEVLGFKVGLPIIALMGSISGGIINHQFRKLLFLYEHGKVTSYIAIAVIPGTLSLLVHSQFTTSKIFDRSDKCSICTQLRAGVTQTVTAVLYPFILSPLISYPVARKLTKYSVPTLTTSNPLSVFKFTKQLTRPAMPIVMTLCAVNAIVSMGITYAQQSSFLEYLEPAMVKRQNDALLQPNITKS